MGMETHEITPEVARGLLALFRTVGVHPETGRTILAGIGRYGPWLSARTQAGRNARHHWRRPCTRYGAGDGDDQRRQAVHAAAVPVH